VIPPDPAAARPPGTVLVTGGTGLLGGLVARHLAAAGRAARVVLASRSGPAAPAAASAAAAVAEAGAAAEVVACDAADRGQLAGLLARIPASCPLAGVIHAAGVIDDAVTGSLTPARIDAVMRPKADAAWHLHQLTAGLDLEQFVLFSSAAAAFGGAGQGNYAAANAFLDGLAAHRRAAGLPAVSLAWGLWADASALTGQLAAADRARIARGGMTALTTEEGLALLDAAAARDEALLIPARVDIAALRAAAARGEDIPALWRGLVGRPVGGGGPPGPAAADGGPLRRQLAAASAPDQDKILLDLVRAHAAAVLGHASPDAVDPVRAFTDLGFDSLTAVELRNRLAATTGLRLPATLVFDYPAPAALADYLRREIVDSDVTSSAVALAEISKLEKMVPNIGSGDNVRVDLVIRMKAMLSVLESGSNTTEADAVDDDIKTATAENIFDILDNELD
jgi:acyl carrier protein